MRLIMRPNSSPSFFFNDTAPTEIYTLSLHDALPISRFPGPAVVRAARVRPVLGALRRVRRLHRHEIGRASCRERGVDLGGRRIIKKKKKKKKDERIEKKEKKKR